MVWHVMVWPVVSWPAKRISSRLPYNADAGSPKRQIRGRSEADQRQIRGTLEADWRQIGGIGSCQGAGAMGEALVCTALSI